MKILKKLFHVTPFKLSLAIVLVFLGATILYDLNPTASSLIGAIEQKSLDFKFRFRGYEPPKSNIVIVAGDEKSFQAFGQWPWNRGTVFAPALERLCGYQPRAVGLDIVWSEYERQLPEQLKKTLQSAWGAKTPPLDEILAKQSGDAALRRAIEFCGKKIVLGYVLAADETGGLPKKEFEKRLEILTEKGGNSIATLTKGPVRYPPDAQEPNVQFSESARTGLLNVPEITPPGVAQGFFNNVPDGDGNYRHGILFYRTPAGFVSSLTLRIAQKELSRDDIPPNLLVQPYLPDRNQGEDLKLDINTATGKHTAPMDLTGKVTVNYRGPNQTFPNVSLVDVLSSKDTIEYDIVDAKEGVKHMKVLKAELFKNALVLVGITAIGLYDIRPRPFDGQASGVENHASILDNLVADDFLVRPTTELLLILDVALLLISLLYGFLIAKVDARWGVVVAVVSIAGLLVLDQKYLFNRGTLFSGYLVAAQFLFQYIAITALKYMREESEKKFIRSAFDKYVSPAIINEMLKDPSKLKLGGDKKELTIMFSDIRGFTELSEKTEVRALTQFLNEYLGSMTDLLQGNRGTLDKYIGDAVMGFWGAPIDLPDHASRAVKTAVQMIERLGELNGHFKEAFNLTIDIGLGINTGPVSVGNFGSTKVFEFTVIGDNVNLASRLEGLNKYYGTNIVISESTYQQLTQGEFLTREIDIVKVKGKKKGVKIYQVFPDNEAHATLKASLKPFNEGLQLYYAQRWDASVAKFNDVLQKRNHDKVAKDLIARCEHFRVNAPGDDWDGSWEMHTK